MQMKINIVYKMAAILPEGVGGGWGGGGGGMN